MNSIIITFFSMLAIYASACFTFAQMGSWIQYVRTVLLKGVVVGTFPALIPANSRFLFLALLGNLCLITLLSCLAVHWDEMCPSWLHHPQGHSPGCSFVQFGHFLFEASSSPEEGELGSSDSLHWPPWQ